MPKRTDSPRPTLAELRQGAPWLWCRNVHCRHKGPMALAPLSIRWGGEASSDLLSNRHGATPAEAGRRPSASQRYQSRKPRQGFVVSTFRRPRRLALSGKTAAPPTWSCTRPSLARYYLADRCPALAVTCIAFSLQTNIPGFPPPESQARLIARQNTTTAARRPLRLAATAWTKHVPPTVWSPGQGRHCQGHRPTLLQSSVLLRRVAAISGAASQSTLPNRACRSSSPNKDVVSPSLL